MRTYFLVLFFLSLTLLLHAQHEVSGTIIDESGTPLAGASVAEQGTSRGTIADIDGTYSITVESSTAVLV
ncbi:MAG: carboxypeptidase-like regulatory domain-containing protein, partial [Saprospiraceae bacterium]|nr:carboxypeptidase-like regulatory domain-containing protein [Saprospiraceae bacterium]